MKTKKLFIVKKYIMATDAKHAIKLDKTSEVDDVFIDADWQRNNMCNPIEGFKN